MGQETGAQGTHRCETVWTGARLLGTLRDGVFFANLAWASRGAALLGALILCARETLVMFRHRQGCWVFWRLAWLVVGALACTLGNAADNAAQSIQSKPLVVILVPVNGSTYAEGVRVELHAIAQEAGPGVARIEFRVDDHPVATVYANNPDGQPTLDARASWVAVDKRSHLITVEAFRADGSSLGLGDVAVKVTDAPSAQRPGGSAPPTSGGTPSTPIPTLTPAPILPTSTSAVPLTGPIARAAVNGLNVRQGPDTAYPTVGILAQGEAVQIVGRNTDGSWWAVSYAGGTAWVFAALTTTEGNVSQVPLVAAPPRP